MSKGQEKSRDELLAEVIENPDPIRRPVPAVSEELPTKGPGERRKTKLKKLAELRENDYSHVTKHGIAVTGSEELREDRGRGREALTEAETESPTLPPVSSDERRAAVIAVLEEVVKQDPAFAHKVLCSFYEIIPPSAQARFLESILKGETTRTIDRPFHEPRAATVEDVWTLIHDIDAELTPTRARVLPKLKSLLTMLAEVGTLGTFEANDKAVKKLGEYLSICKQQLTYTDMEKNIKGVPVTVDCLDLADYKAGAVRIYRGSHGKTITQKSWFPPFGLMPVEDSSAE